MLDQKFLELPLWVWIIVIAIVTYSVYQTMCEKTIPKSETKSEIKEKFTVTSNSSNSSNKPIVKIFNFNATWCGWSIKFQPEWDEFAKHVVDSKNGLSHVNAYDIKCDDKFKTLFNKELNKTNGELSEMYTVPGYPYVIIEVNESRKTYNGDRTADALIAFVSKI